MAFVLDASITYAWLFPEEGSAKAERVIERIIDEPAIVPSLWWFEVRNVLLTGERKGLVKREQTEAALAKLALLGIEVDQSINEPALLALAREHRLTIYDATYLALAVQRGVPIATLDHALIRAAAASGIAAL